MILFKGCESILDNDETTVQQKNKTAKSPVSVIINCVFYFILIFCVFVSSSSMLAKYDKSLFGIRTFIVLTGSMSPTFDAGSFIMVRQKAPEDIQAGDILSFKMSDNATTLTHRVVEVIQTDGKYSYRTRGDANNIDDANPVPSDRVIGVVFFWINGLGYLFSYLQHPLAIAAIFAVMGLMFVVPEVLSFFKKAAHSNKTE